MEYFFYDCIGIEWLFTLWQSSGFLLQLTKLKSPVGWMEEYWCGRATVQQLEASFTIRSRRWSCSGAKYDLEWWNLSWKEDENFELYPTDGGVRTGMEVDFKWCYTPCDKFLAFWFRWRIWGKHGWVKEDCCQSVRGQILDQEGSRQGGSGTMKFIAWSCMDGSNVILLWSVTKRCSSQGLVRSRLNKPADAGNSLTWRTFWRISLLEDLSKETLVILSIEKLEVDLRALSQLSPWFLHFPIPFFPILPIIPLNSLSLPVVFWFPWRRPRSVELEWVWILGKAFRSLFLVKVPIGSHLMGEAHTGSWLCRISIGNSGFWMCWIMDNSLGEIG